MEKIENGIIYLNIRGLLLLSNKTKCDLLKDMATEENCYAIVITEMWLKPWILDAEIKIDGFRLYRSDRSGQNHGGVAIYIKKRIFYNCMYVGIS